MWERHGVVLFVTQAEAAASQTDFGPIIPEMFNGPRLLEIEESLSQLTV